jgi:hypothetical protein
MYAALQLFTKKDALQLSFANAINKFLATQHPDGSRGDYLFLRLSKVSGVVRVVVVLYWVAIVDTQHQIVPRPLLSLAF